VVQWLHTFYSKLFQNLNVASRHMQTMTGNLSVSMARDDIWRTHCGKIGQVDEHRSIHENFRGTSCSNGKGTDPERPGRPEKKQVQPGCERLHNVWRKHPQPPNPQSEMGTLATHSGRTFDSLPLIHMGKFMRKHGTSGTTMFGQRHPKIFFLQILS